MSLKRALQVHPGDNVSTVLAEVPALEPVLLMQKDGSTSYLVARSPIPYGHKVAVRPISMGADVIKYGESIGAATSDIQPGDHVHVHNLDSRRGKA